MNKGDRLNKLLNRDDRLHSKYNAVWWLWYRTDDNHPDKSRLHERAMKLYSLCEANTSEITRLINGVK